MKFSWFNRFFSKFKTTQDYKFEFRVSFPLTSGLYEETGKIRITIPASNAEEAKRKLKKYVLSKVKATVVSVEEVKSIREPIKSKVKSANPQHN